MRTMKKSCFAVLMAALVAFSAIFSVCLMPQQAQAQILNPSLQEEPYSDVLYYFSDSEPLFEEEAKSFADNSGKDIVYDGYQFLTPQQLAFMVYTGYFWRFDGSPSSNVAVLELKMPGYDDELIDALVRCFQAQQCKVLLICGFDTDAEGTADEFIRCGAADEYWFIEDMLSDVRGDITGAWQGTVFLDDKFASGANGGVFSEVYAYSPFLRRLLSGLQYSAGAVVDYEELFYGILWDYYTQTCYDLPGYGLNYLEGDTNIDAYVSIWGMMDDENSQYEDGRPAFREGFDEFLAESDELEDWITDEDGCQSVWKNSVSHLYAYAGYSKEEDAAVFYDLLDNSVNEEGELRAARHVWETFADIQPALNANGHMFAAGVWSLPSLLYNFWDGIQSWLETVETEPGEEPYFPVYIWEDDPINWTEGGLEIISDSMLREEYNRQGEYVVEDLLAEFTLYLEILFM